MAKASEERKRTMSEAFEQAKRKIIGIDRQRIGIGTLSEKTQHAILKNYYEPDEDYHEVPIGRFFADIYREGRIIEIQTGQFQRMREKLDAFLPEYDTTIVYPIAYERWLNWIDPDTGEVRERRKVSQKGKVYEIFPELYKIKAFLKDPNLTIRILMVQAEDYKLLDGWGDKRKNHASKYDRVPMKICEEIVLEEPRDYLQLVPFSLENGFTSREFAKAGKINQGLAGITLNILDYVGVVKRIGREKNAYIYEICE